MKQGPRQSNEIVKTGIINSANFNHILIQFQVGTAQYKCGAFKEWGNWVYTTCIAASCLTAVSNELAAFVSLAEDFRSNIDNICKRSFEADPSGLGQAWKAAMMLHWNTERVIDVVNELLLLLQGGGIELLKECFHEKSLNFQSF
ncbi:hypothetical protein BD410DRAFT_799573 [Rickenella mellea]|uniref:Uncharacterized protein n=1 Tax=Rickenella mellea TaxID=50990 RepID=A0A4Y7QHP6_9AGAM|nr:hypothetical protein BD410DRAFT_799573 [Rickenella mellea]